MTTVKPEVVVSSIGSHAVKSAPVSSGYDAQDCPIFLRKAYHMVDTCDPSIACWSEDGETFVVKNTEVFEKVIIPQFFKHSKFSSFVRQLNFYGFRKIKYADTIKIDRKLEAETANFWRFKHEKFQRGKPELLGQIKRSNGQHKQSASKTGGVQKQEDVGSLKSEVTTLKERIDTMTKNIDALTTLVSKVTLKQDERTDTDDSQVVGSKRKKIETSNASIRADEVKSHMDLDDMSYTPGAVFPPEPQVAKRESSGGSALSQISDDSFVDGLFTAFENDIGMGLLEEENFTGDVVEESTLDENRPDSQLMGKLSDALALVPREIQELIVDRLVAAITSSDSLAKTVKSMPSEPESTSKPNVVENVTVDPSQLPAEVSLPVAAAALAAMISQCSAQLKDKTTVQKSLPIIPIH